MPGRLRHLPPCAGGVQAHEVLIAAEYLQTHVPPGEYEAVIDRVAVHRAAFAGRTGVERAAVKTPCALLRVGHCSLYATRPEAEAVGRRFMLMLLVFRRTTTSPRPNLPAGARAAVAAWAGFGLRQEATPASSPP